MAAIFRNLTFVPDFLNRVIMKISGKEMTCKPVFRKGGINNNNKQQQ